MEVYLNQEFIGKQQEVKKHMYHQNKIVFLCIFHESIKVSDTGFVEVLSAFGLSLAWQAGLKDFLMMLLKLCAPFLLMILPKFCVCMHKVVESTDNFPALSTCTSQVEPCSSSGAGICLCCKDSMKLTWQFLALSESMDLKIFKAM